jgi:ferric-dicitrate binding protein FerR (iron transport regulator)
MDEETTGRLLRIGGRRAEVPADREGRVKGAFLQECSVVARSRLVRRRMVTAAAMVWLAATAIVGVRVWSPREAPKPLQPIVATVERVEGASTPIAAAATVRAGAAIETGATDRVGLRLVHGASLRFDRASRARLVSPLAIELDAGAVYVDSGPQSPNLEIHTSFGIVRDIGTQFEVRLSDSSLRVRVRSGLVEVRGVVPADVSSARPGTELTLGRTGTSSRSVPPYGPDWAWAAGLAPAFSLEGQTLDAFLEHVCREQGWTLGYANLKLAREASGIILHGQTAGLQPTEALAVVLATTGLTHRLADGALVVARVRE